MKNIGYYDGLPEFMDEKALKQEFEYLLNDENLTGEAVFLDALVELSFRKEGIDMDIDENLRQKAGKLAMRFWDDSSRASTEDLIMVIFNLELKETFLDIKSKYSEIKSDEVKKELQDCFEDARNGPPPLKYW